MMLSKLSPIKQVAEELLHDFKETEEDGLWVNKWSDSARCKFFDIGWWDSETSPYTYEVWERVQVAEAFFGKEAHRYVFTYESLWFGSLLSLYKVNVLREKSEEELTKNWGYSSTGPQVKY